jgi:hypothetical protein
VAVFRPFPITSAKGKPHQGTAQAVDVAARHLVYKLFEETKGQPMAWHLLGGIGERPETVAKAVERGWLVVREEDGVNGTRKAQSASLTDEGRLVARKGLRG